jgi:hypothetical protein
MPIRSCLVKLLSLPNYSATAFSCDDLPEKLEKLLANFDESDFFNIAVGDNFFEGILVQLREEGFSCRL